MKPYPIAIPAGKEYVEQFGAGANYIRLDEGATVSVTVKSYVNDDEYILQPGDDVTFSPFSELAISHHGSALTAFILYVGRGTKANSPRIGGTVQVTGGANNVASPPLVEKYYSSRRKQSYVAALAGTALPATFWNVFQLWNPLGSGVDLLLYRAETGSATTFIGLVDVINYVNGVLTVPNNEIALAGGAPVRKAEIYFASDSIFNGMSIPEGTGEPNRLISALYFAIAKYKAGMLIPPGYGAVISTQQTAIGSAGFEWDEF